MLIHFLKIPLKVKKPFCLVYKQEIVRFKLTIPI